METKISEEEFMRLQNQLILLRTANYSLEEQNAAYKVQTKETSARLEALEKEYSRLSSSLSSLKQTKQIDLFKHNEALQLKLQAQEDDFRLQNETLMKELALLDAENRKLQCQVSACEVESGEATEVKTLKEEASALSKVLSEERLRSANEISKLKAALNLLTNGFDEDTRKCFWPDLEDDSAMNVSAESEIEESIEISGDEMEMTSETGIQSKVELESIISKCGGDVEILTDLIKNKDRYESLKKTVASLDGRFVNLTSVSDQIIYDLEKKWADAVEEVSVLKTEKADLQTQILNLSLELREKGMESENMHAQLGDAMKNLERAKSFAENLENENCTLIESIKNLRISLTGKDEVINKVTKRCSEIEEEYKHTKKDMEIKQEATEKEMKGLLDEMEELKEKYKSLEESKNKEAKELTQKLSDLSADRALIEKKNAVICRDLKRQLALERRRAEKLQEILGDIDVSNIKQESSKAGDAEVTSVSSWSLMSGNMEPHEQASTQDSNAAGSPTNVNGNQPEELDLEHENKNLLERLTSLQEEKWLLEEQVNHLEQGSAAMAEDLMKKADIIKYYCMDLRSGEHQPSSNSGRKGVKRLSEFLKGSEGESMQESLAHMQRMLEETLTKNMYLQRDLEHLSKELESAHISNNEPPKEK